MIFINNLQKDSSFMKLLRTWLNTLQTSQGCKSFSTCLLSVYHPLNGQTIPMTRYFDWLFIGVSWNKSLKICKNIDISSQL